MKVQKILLTGGSGFIGKNIIAYYEESSEVVIDSPSSSELDCLDEKAVKKWLDKGNYDIILNFAGYSPVGSKTEKDGEKIFEYNMRMFMNFAKYSCLYKRMFWTGSGAEYDRSENVINVKEQEIANYPIPNDQYGLEKYCIGQYIENSNNIYNLRLFGIFGPYEFAERRFISNMIICALNHSDYLIRKNSKFDYLWIKDFLHILDLFIHTEKLEFHTYNVASGRGYELRELAEIVKNVSGWNGNIIVESDELGKEYTVDISRLRSQFPEIKLTDMDQSISELYQWYVSKGKS